jgi:hypothetical protein
MKKVELIETIEHPKGNISKGAILIQEEEGLYKFYQNGICILSANEAGVKAATHLFKPLDDE